MIAEILTFISTIDPELLKTLGLSGSSIIAIATVGTLALKSIKKQQQQNFIALTAIMVKLVRAEAMQVVKSMNDLADSYESIIRRNIHTYAEKAVSTAPSAVAELFCCENCQSQDLFTSLYMEVLRGQFDGSVVKFILEQISECDIYQPETSFRMWARSGLSTGAFNSFLSPLREKFDQKKMRDRIDWIESVMDRRTISDLCESIAMECRIVYIDFEKKQNEDLQLLQERITRDIIASQKAVVE